MIETDTWLATAHVLGWSIHVGGAVTMEWVLRYAQRTMPPSQVGVVCQQSGHRYRWVALASIVVVGLTGLAMVIRFDDTDMLARTGAASLTLANAYGRTLALLVGAWAVVFAAVASMAFVLHPAQARRSLPDATKEEIQQERQRVGRAIRRMELALRTELVVSLVAIGLGASLRHGGLF